MPPSAANPPPYVPPHGLLAGRSVLVTAAAGGGIGFATARRVLEEGARALVIADIHPRRLEEAVQALRRDFADRVIEGQLAKVMYWALHKQHQLALGGWKKTALITLSEMIDRTYRPRIKLH